MLARIPPAGGRWFRITSLLLCGVLLAALASSCGRDDADRHAPMRGDVGVLADGGRPGGTTVLEARVRDCRWVLAAGHALARSDRPWLRRLGRETVRSTRPRLAMMLWMRLGHGDRDARTWRVPSWPAAGSERDRAALTALGRHTWRRHHGRAHAGC